MVVKDPRGWTVAIGGGSLHGRRGEEQLAVVAAVGAQKVVS